MMQGPLSSRLLAERIRRGLTLQDAAREAGVDRHTLSRIERGTQGATGPTLRKLSEFYNIPVEEMLEEPVLSGKA